MKARLYFYFQIIALIFLFQSFNTKSLLAQDVTFTLIDASTNQPIPGFDPLFSNQIINFRFLPPQLSIRANVPSQCESVRFILQKEETTLAERVENVPPYALAGDNNGNYNPFTFTGIGGDNQRLLQQRTPRTAQVVRFVLQDSSI